MGGTVSSWLERNGIYVALIAAWTAMLGSLYFSEVAGYIPCTLCWYQRILMYPLAAIIAIGLLRRDAGLHAYVLPFSGLGVLISTYHYLLQKTDLFSDAAACGVGVPCTGIWINWLGFITIPFLAMAAFIIITVTTLIAMQAAQEAAEDADATAPYGEATETPWIPVGVSIVSVVVVFAFLGMIGRGDTLEAAPVASIVETHASMDGALLYQQACAACHGADLEGVEGLGNPLAPSTFVDERTDAELLAFIRAGRGLEDPANTTGLIMPASGGRPDLSDDALLAVIEHMRAAQPGTTE